MQVSRIIEAPGQARYHACPDPDALSSWRGVAWRGVAWRVAVGQDRTFMTLRTSRLWNLGGPSNKAPICSEYLPVTGSFEFRMASS